MGMTVWQSVADRAEAMTRDAFKDVRTLEDWKRERPRRKREFLVALGLDQLPERCDPKVTERGTFTGPGYRVRRIGFQILPDCWSSATVYYPDPLPARAAPGVLYVCGHATIGTFHYQYHPMLWARRGYVCLIVDTIEQNDNPGEHHGSMMGRNDAWLSLGYSAAGGEVFNAIRALDLLAADPRVDPERLGVTGVSGGGACSFLVATIDERLKAVSTLCGVSTPFDAIVNRHLFQNCDCFYPINVAGRDLAEYAALIAPRAALFCFADHDTLFHPAETAAFVERTRHVYRLHGLDAHCALVTCPGPHGDHPEFDEATARWFDRHVAGEERPPLARGAREVEEEVTTVFNGQTPAPNHVALLPQLLTPRGDLPLPAGVDDWPAIRRAALARLPAGVGADPAAPGAYALDGDWRWSERVMFRAHRGRIGGLDTWIHAVTPLDSRPAFVLSIGGEGESVMQALSRIGASVDAKATAYAAYEPRMAGFNAPASTAEPRPPGSNIQSVRGNLLRAMALVGTTPVMMTIHDLGVAVEYLCGLEEMRGRAIYLYGKGDAGVAALYRGLLDERVAGVIAEDLPSSHLDGAPILGVLRAFDLPEAVGLMAPRKVALVNPGHCFWTWPARVYARLGCPERFIMAGDLRQGLDKILA